MPKIQVIDREIAADDVVACARAEDMTKRYFDDDQEAPCMVCGHTVVFRPYMAKGRKVCTHCLPADSGPRH